ELAADRNGLQREAVRQGMGILGDAYKQGMLMMPKPGSTADELVKLKEAGLLNTGNSNGFGLADIKVLLEWGLPRLREMGILGTIAKEADPKKEFEKVLELIEVVETRFGRSKGEASVWPTVIQTFGPPIVKMFDNITANVADIFRARAAMSGTP